MGWELFFSTGSLHDVVAKGSDPGVKSPPCLFQAVYPWAYEKPSLSPVALFCRMGIKRVPPSRVDPSLEGPESYTILEDLIKKKFNYE